MRSQNAKIGKTHLGYEDHGIFTFYLMLDYGNSGQGAGGYALDAYVEKKGRIGTKKGMDLIITILKLFEIDTWEELPGTYIKVKATHDHVHAIAPLFADDDDKEKWLNFKEFFSKGE